MLDAENANKLFGFWYTYIPRKQDMLMGYKNYVKQNTIAEGARPGPTQFLSIWCYYIAETARLFMWPNFILIDFFGDKSVRPVIGNLAFQLAYDVNAARFE